MINKSYQLLLKLITNTLQEKPGTLHSDEISNTIKTMKKTVNGLGVGFLKMFGLETPEPMTEELWKKIELEIESKFIVRIDKGILVQSQKSRDRDLTWWSGKKKLENDNYYFNNYYEYMKKTLAKKILDVTDEDTDVVMNNLANPNGEPFAIKGMVVGHVQSGKTSNYSALIAKAADAGYRFIVVIAGAQNNLRDQTQKRLQESFIGVKNMGVGSLPDFDPSRMPDCLTSETSDFKKDIAKSRKTTNFENMKLPILVVIKKHTKTLDQLLEWLNDNYPNQVDKPMLVIDDESDYASINTKGENDPTVINKKIRLLLQKFTKSAYVAYTATPYANIFINHQAKNEEVGEDLFPSDFIYALNPPDNYFGAQVVFNEDEDSETISSKYVRHIPNSEVVMDLEVDKANDETYEEALISENRFLIRHKSDYVINELPPSLKEAIRVFILNVSIRNLRGQIKHNSMLVHITRFTQIHIHIKTLIKEYFEEIKRDIKAYGKLPVNLTKSKTLMKLEDTFRRVHSEVEIDYLDVLDNIISVIDTIQVIDVHQKTKIPLQYRDDIQTNAIVIGGLSLARGFTLEGLSVSYFLRTTIFYDTLMQMGRWFGYRMGYQDLCRVYITEAMHRNFIHINKATLELMSKLKEMEFEKRTPEEFGLAVQTHPDSLLQITARNKSKFTEDMYLSMDLKGQLKETRYMSSDKKDILRNDLATDRFISNLFHNHSKKKKKGNTLIWEEVDNSKINDFLTEYQFYDKDKLGLKTRFPLDFIREFVKNYDGKWDIVIHSGEKERVCLNDGSDLGINRQRRVVESLDGYYKTKKTQLARGRAESVLMEDNSIKSGYEMRKKLKRPVLFVHYLTLEINKDNEEELVGLSFSFNNDSKLENDIVKVKINSVYIQLIEEATRNAEKDEEYDEVSSYE